MTQTSPKALATSLFQKAFASHPAVLASAPGRVNLIGEHMDYNGGPVLPFAIQRRTVVAASLGTAWHAVSAIDGTTQLVDPTGPAAGGWTDYLRGVIRALAHDGLAPRGAQVAVASTVPVGAGLASSAALTVALTRALVHLAGRRVPPERLADIAYRAEHDEVGVACGRMDQTVAALASPGLAMLLETATGEITGVPFPGHVIVVETGVAHELSRGALNQRRHECEEALRMLRERGVEATHLADIAQARLGEVERLLPPPWMSRARHVVTEASRTREAVHALQAHDLVRLGRLLQEGHRSLRDDYQSSCREADWLVDGAVRHGAYGARLTGAGWGGAVIVLANEAAESRIMALVGEEFNREFGRFPEMWKTSAGRGATVEH